ncbi:MAG: single-stranded DNA-binding protein [Alphaproteobacteria bacterium]|nr:single-stranded DNA-binding protein [Alphaproteobacteria bacterium]
MAGSINKVTLLGNLGSDPQVRTMQSGQKVVTFSLATSEQWKDKSTGEKKEQTEWHRVVIFQPNLAEVAERMLQKGTKLFVEGTLRTRKWQNQQGLDVYTTEVVLNMGATMIILGNAKPAGGDYGDAFSGGSGGSSTSAPQREEISVSEIGDDIPF